MEIPRNFYHHLVESGVPEDHIIHFRLLQYFDSYFGNILIPNFAALHFPILHHFTSGFCLKAFGDFLLDPSKLER